MIDKRVNSLTSIKIDIACCRKFNAFNQKQTTENQVLHISYVLVPEDPSQK